MASLRCFVLVAIATGLLLPAKGVLAGDPLFTLLDEDFDDSPVDGVPNSIGPGDFILGEVGTNTKSTIQIAGTGGLYEDPFDPATSNRSLAIDQFDRGCNTPDCLLPGGAGTEFPVVTWKDEMGDVPNFHRSGTVEFDLYLSSPEASDFWTYLDFRVGFGDEGRANPQTTGDTLLWMSYRVQAEQERLEPRVFVDYLGVFADQDDGDQTGTLERDEVNKIRYVFDGDTETFQWFINDEQMTHSIDLLNPGNPDWPWHFGGEGAGFNSVDFQSAFGFKTGELFIDNLVIKSTNPPPPPDLAADFDKDGDVDGDDFLVWQSNFGTTEGATSNTGDTDGDGDVDGDDFLSWQQEFGSGVGGNGASAVPEPGSLGVLIVVAVMGLGSRRSRRNI